MTGNAPPVAVCVVGAGIVGSWTALHLAEAGVRTTLIEQFPLPHTRGSSHGLSRAFRFLGELELDRLDYSLDRWQELEKAIGETLFIKTGLLNLGHAGDPDLERFMAVLRDAQRPFEWLDNATIAARYPQLEYSEGWGAAYDPNGGILIAQRCLNAVQSRFLALGGKIVTRRVESIESEARFFDRVVVCAGPWTARLLPQLAGLLRSVLTPVTYWRDPGDSYSVAKGFPILFNARLTDIYGLPSCEYPGLVKILFHGGPESDPETRDQASIQAEVGKVSEYIRDHLKLLDHDKPAILETCMYTMTPDGNPVIDRLSGNLVVGCGFSGSGFKHSPATGYMLASLALEQEDSVPAGFRADRYLMSRFQ
ncbi:MAG: FAD-dependent oxidoreductase [Woeseiaceae bacterium]|nr:FAD-dependent oxidoreductase [Woeseiaceae bacterium]